MTVRLRHNYALELNRVEYSGAVTSAELFAHAQYRGEHALWLNYDHLNVIMPDSDASHLQPSDLNRLLVEHRTLFEPQKLLIKRRSAWVCLSPSTLALLHHWMRGRQPDIGEHTDVRVFDTFEAAGEWLVLRADEIAIAARGEGFAEIARFTLPPAQALSR